MVYMPLATYSLRSILGCIDIPHSVYQFGLIDVFALLFFFQKSRHSIVAIGSKYFSVY